MLQPFQRIQRIQKNSADLVSGTICPNIDLEDLDFLPKRPRHCPPSNKNWTVMLIPSGPQTYSLAVSGMKSIVPSPRVVGWPSPILCSPSKTPPSILMENLDFPSKISNSIISVMSVAFVLSAHLYDTFFDFLINLYW